MRLLRVAIAALGLAALPIATSACTPQGKVPLVIHVPKNAPPDAAVIVDERYVGTLAAFEKNGLLLPVGEHRITVERSGYFPWDRLVEADRAPIELEVELVRIPD